MLSAQNSPRCMTDRAMVIEGDYRSVRLPRIKGKTLFIGNPPYVRHHDIPAKWKTWYRNAADEIGIKASGLRRKSYLVSPGYHRL
jgi:hypothetical protein